MAVNLVRTSTRGVRSLNQAHFNAPWPFVKKGTVYWRSINEIMSSIQEHTVKGRSDLSELKRINGRDRIDSSLNWVPSGIKRIQRYFISERIDLIPLLIYTLLSSYYHFSYTNVRPEGYIDEVSGKFIAVPEMRTEIIAPDLTEFKYVNLLTQLNK